MSVLVGLDGSGRSTAALAYAAETFPSAPLVVFHAIDPFDRDPEDATAEPLTEAWLAEERERVDRLFDRAIADVELEDDRVRRETTVGKPAEAIVAFAEEDDVETVVVGSYGLGEAERLRLGSVAETVVRRSPVPVIVVR